MDSQLSEKITQYGQLATDYFNLAEGQMAGTSPHIFLYLHATQLLLKQTILERHGSGERVLAWHRQQGNDLEKTHDFDLLTNVLFPAEVEFRRLREIEPSMTTFRYPGPRFVAHSPGLLGEVRTLARSVRGRLTGRPADLWHCLLVVKANELAEHAHGDQQRKFGGEPYVTHVRRVAQAVAERPWATEVDVAAAVAHDILEDTGYGEDRLRDDLGDEVVGLVRELTKPTQGPEWEDKPRAVKKAAELEHLRRISPRAMRIKLADRLDNLSGSMPEDFREKYLTESRALAEVAGPADPALHRRLMAVIDALMGSSVREECP